MPVRALALVLAAALIHAAWNLLAKQARDQAAFLLVASGAAALLSLPLALGTLAAGAAPQRGLVAAAASALVHALYFSLLGAGYRRGDLSVVYPVARGTSPLLVALLAGPLLGQRLPPLGAAGVAAVVVGLGLVSAAGVSAERAPGETARLPRVPAGIGLGLAVGACSAAYSLVDRVGVSVVTPLAYLALQMQGAALLMLPAWLGDRTRRARLAAAARNARLVGLALLCGAGMLGAYGLVLTAMTLAPVALVVAGREIAIVFAAGLGALVLGEPVGTLRALGVAAVTVGVALLALA